MNSDEIRKILGKTVSVLMLILGIYQLLLSIVSIFYIYPEALGSREFVPFKIQESLIEKAIILYASTVVNGFYGMTLLVKPSQEVKTIHILIGVVIFVFSLFFVTRTRLTSDPLLEVLVNLFKSN